MAERLLDRLRRWKRELAYEAYDGWRSLAHRQRLKTVVNQREIRFIGLRRSGNHGVLSWIKQQAPGEVYFLNNVDVRESPFRFYHLHFPDRGYCSEAWGNFTPKNYLIYSYEDHDLAAIADPNFEAKHDLYVGKSRQRYDVLILRDPFNLLASRLKKNYLTVKAAGKSVVDLWLDYAREYLGETHYLSQEKVVINFSHWVQDIDYRRDLATRLGLTFSDAGIDYISSYGGGSSFDGQTLSGSAAARLGVTQRWQYFMNDERFLALIRNEELIEYARQIFGANAAVETLLSRA